MSHRAKIRSDDLVKVIAGKDKGKTGKVLRVDIKQAKVYVEGLNVQKRHQRPMMLRDTQRTQSAGGGGIEREGPIHISNVMLIDPKTGDPTRVGIKREGGRRVRIAKRSGQEVD
jgi:large subunit ribosomal protein L24